MLLHQVHQCLSRLQVWANTEDRGFVLVTLTRAAHRVDMMKVSTVASMNVSQLLGRLAREGCRSA